MDSETKENGKAHGQRAAACYVEQIQGEHEQAMWMDQHESECPGDVEINVLTIPGSMDSKIRPIRVCDRCRSYWREASDLDRFVLRSTYRGNSAATGGEKLRIEQRRRYRRNRAPARRRQQCYVMPLYPSDKIVIPF